MNPVGRATVVVAQHWQERSGGWFGLDGIPDIGNDGLEGWMHGRSGGGSGYWPVAH